MTETETLTGVLDLPIPVLRLFDWCSDLPVPGGQRPQHDGVAAGRACAATVADAEPLPHQTEGGRRPEVY